jgi:hypothetical protein
MLEDDFYATIKLKCGDEIFCKVSPSIEGEKTSLLICDPITIEEIVIRGKVNGYKLEPWLKTCSEGFFLIDLDDVLTISENSDIEMIAYYTDYITRLNGSFESQLDRRMGHIGKVEEVRKSLEKIFEKS